MKVAIIGATGNAGTRLVNELLSRGHQVTGISRHPEKLEAREGLTAVAGDVKDVADTTNLLRGHDVAIHSVRYQDSDVEKVIAAAKSSGVKRLMIVGGASSLEVAPGLALFDAPGFPEAYRPEAGAGIKFLKRLREEKELNWTYLSPSTFFTPGERTGKFRLGMDQLLTGADGQSKISMEDYAIAMVDEIENPKHIRQRFTVGY